MYPDRHVCMMFGVTILLLPPVSQCEYVCLWDASQCVSYALLSPTRHKTWPVWKTPLRLVFGGAWVWPLHP